MARRRDRARAAQPAPGPGDRLAGPGPGDARARGVRRAHPSGQRAAGQRVAPHHRLVARARAQRLPGLAADGRDPARQLHGLRRRRALAGVRPVDRRRGLGARLLPAREPGAQARRVLLPDRLRRLAAAARGRRRGGAADRRLQRRDDRADRALPARARPRDLRRLAGRRRAATRSATGCRRSAPGSRSTSTSRGYVLAPGAGEPAPALRRARLPRQRRRLGRRRQPAAEGDRRLSRGARARPGPAHEGGLRPAHRPGVGRRAGRRRAGRLRARPLARAGRLRRRGHARRPHHLHGAGRRQAPLPVRAARAPLRAALPRAPPARALRRRPDDRLRDVDAGVDRRRARRRPGRRREPGRRRARRRRARRRG